MVGFTTLSIICASLLIYIGAISDMSMGFKITLFVIIDLIFLRIILNRRDPYEKKLSLVLLIYSIVLPITYGAFLLLKYSDKDVKKFGIVLLIICFFTIISSSLYFIKTIKKIIMDNFERKIYYNFGKIDGIDGKITFLQNEIKKLSGKDSEKIKFLYKNIIDYNLAKIEAVDDKITFLQNEIKKLSEKDIKKIKFLYTSIIEYNLSEIEGVGNKITFLQNEIEKLSEKDNVVRKILKEKLRYFNIHREHIENQEQRMAAKNEEYAEIYNEMASYVENKDFLETDLEHVFEEEEGCFLIIDNVRRVTKYHDNKGHRKYREMYRGTLYITNKKLWLKSYQKTNPIIVLAPLTDILEIYKNSWFDDEFGFMYLLKLIISKTNKEEDFILEIDREIDTYKAMICIEEAQKYL